MLQRDSKSLLYQIDQVEFIEFLSVLTLKLIIDLIFN